MDSALKYTGGGLLLGVLLCAGFLAPEPLNHPTVTASPTLIVTAYHFSAAAGIPTP